MSQSNKNKLILLLKKLPQNTRNKVIDVKWMQCLVQLITKDLQMMLIFLSLIAQNEHLQYFFEQIQLIRLNDVYKFIEVGWILIIQQNHINQSKILQLSTFVVTYTLNNQILLQKVLRMCRNNQLDCQIILKYFYLHLSNQIITQSSNIIRIKIQDKHQINNNNSMNKKTVSQKCNCLEFIVLLINLIKNYTLIRQQLLQISIQLLILIWSIHCQYLNNILSQNLKNLSIWMVKQHYYEGFKLLAFMMHLNLQTNIDQQQIIQLCYNIIINIIEPNISLKQQIAKIIVNKQNNIKLYQLRCIALYVEQVIYYIGKNDISCYYNIIIQMLDLNDQYIYACCCRAISTLLQNHQHLKTYLITENIFQKSLINNCIGNPFTTQQPIVVNSYYCTGLNIVVAQDVYVKQTFTAQCKLVECLVLSKDPHNRQILRQEINKIIEYQFDWQFEIIKFSSACNTINILLKLQQNKIQQKQQVINYMKMLLNLNQSCSYQNRYIINNKIFQLLLSYPILLLNNYFLEEILENHLINRYPKTKKYLQQFINVIIQYYSFDIINGKIYDRIMQKMLSIKMYNLTYQYRICLWIIIFKLHISLQKDPIDLFEIYSDRDQQYLCKQWTAKISIQKWKINQEKINLLAEKYNNGGKNKIQLEIIHYLYNM